MGVDLHLPRSLQEKVQEIEGILVHPDGIDLWKLREACLSEGGLVHGTWWYHYIHSDELLLVVGCAMLLRNAMVWWYRVAFHNLYILQSI